MKKFLKAVPLLAILAGLASSQTEDRASLTFTEIPRAAIGGPDQMGIIAGKVNGPCSECKIVLMARGGDVWYVQPWAEAPFTTIRDGVWKSDTHLGSAYAALLVHGSYQPPAKMAALPQTEGDVLFVAEVDGLREPEAKAAPPREIQFAGYTWAVKSSSAPVEPGPNLFGDENVWVDDAGKLHLRMVWRDGHWRCAEVVNQRALGFGTYSFVVSDTAQLSPQTVLGLFTWNDHSDAFSHREIDVEVGRWGKMDSANAQCVVQPHTISENVARFELPPGRTVASLTWAPAQVHCRVSQPGSIGEETFAYEHTFSRGIPPANEAFARINLWRFGRDSSVGNAQEIVIEDFRFTPAK